MVPNKGTGVHRPGKSPDDNYAVAIAAVLRDELGASARAAKTLARWTGASERAAKYWMSGTRGPDGWNLILLARNSDAVFHFVLRMAHRDAFEVSVELEAARLALFRAVAIIEALGPIPSDSAHHGLHRS